MTSSNRKFLIFSLQGALYALDLIKVAEVGDPPLLWPIPLAPSCFSGALNFHGDIVSVLDLALFLGLHGSVKPGKFIVLDREVASLGFFVDTIVKIVSEDEVSFKTPPDDKYAAATLGLADCEAIQLDVEVVVQEAELCMQRKQ